MTIKTEIRKSNELLRELNGLFPAGDGVHQTFMWKWSSDLYDLVPSYTANGEPEFTYHCKCGIDVRVHAASCTGMTIPVTKVVKTQLVDPNGPFGAYPNMWMLCRWTPPISKDDWIDQMGSENDYNPEGAYRPVSRGAASVVIPPRAVPLEFLAITRRVIDMMREHALKQAAQVAESSEIKLEVPVYNAKGEMIDAPPKEAKFWALKDRLKDVMRKFNPGSTVGYGAKSADFTINHSDRSLADYGSPLQKQREQDRLEMAEEVRKEVAREIPIQEG